MTAEMVVIDNRPRRRIVLIAPNCLKKSFAALLLAMLLAMFGF